MTATARFRYDGEVVRRFPTTVGGVVHADVVANGTSPPGLARSFGEEQAAVLARIGGAPLWELPSVAAWRRVFSGFGAEPTRYRNAAEALLRRLEKQGSLPAVSTLVDLGNLVSIRHALPVAVFDLAAVHGPITVRFAHGDEPFLDLGSNVVERPEPGEVIFLDDAGTVHARRWCWRQSRRSATRPETTEILVVVEGHHDAARADVAAALDDIGRLLPEYAARAGITRGPVESPARAQA